MKGSVNAHIKLEGLGTSNKFKNHCSKLSHWKVGITVTISAQIGPEAHFNSEHSTMQSSFQTNLFSGFVREYWIEGFIK